ncbi:hypothetical protein ACFYTS_07395 [Nocardia sp. NPDC004151]|uniref:hypothetical protein n=1 Tax=Nocardia sp. NPDC004151 TaxID=3364304 RepID=UPI0036BABFC1
MTVRTLHHYDRIGLMCDRPGAPPMSSACIRFWPCGSWVWDWARSQTCSRVPWQWRSVDSYGVLPRGRAGCPDRDRPSKRQERRPSLSKSLRHLPQPRELVSFAHLHRSGVDRERVELTPETLARTGFGER